MALSEADRARILEMFDAGHPRNEIARQIGVSGSTVTTVCRKEGRLFDRSAQLLDLRAIEEDLGELRDLVTKKMLIVANDALDSLDGPHLVFNFGGRDNDYAEHLLDEAPLETKLDAMRAASLAVDKATRIVERSNPGLEQAAGILGGINASLEFMSNYMRENEMNSDDAFDALEAAAAQERDARA